MLRYIGIAGCLGSFCLAAVTVWGGLPNEAGPPSPIATSGQVTAKLVADTDAVRPGVPFRVGVRFDLKPGWHIFWKNPGDAGLATSVTLTLPAGFTAGPLCWPRPAAFNSPGNIVEYGYSDSALLYATITPPANLKPGGAATLYAAANWLACEKLCVPGKADLELTLPVGATAGPTNADLFSGWAAKSDTQAPAFTLKDQDGHNVSLSDYPGRIVVLEWINQDCPFVQYHYRNEVMTMVRLADKYRPVGVVWLVVNSTYYWTAGQSKAFHDQKKLPYPILDDHDGTVGLAYGAKATPHMFVIDREGFIVYQGAIDNAPLGRPPAGSVAVNYVEKTLDELLANRPISTGQTKPYGCSMKYAPAPDAQSARRSTG